MIRRRLPKQRPSQTISFAVGDAEGYLTAGEYPGDGLGEIFVKLGKQGSTLSGVMDAFAISISLGLQYGVPLEAYVSKFVNMRFEPAGMTDDPDVRIATSVMDYLFRRLALDHLPYEKRAQLGIFSADERTAQVAGTDYAANYGEVDLEGLRTGVEASPARSTEPHRQGRRRQARRRRGPRRRRSRSAAPPSCWSCGWARRPTRRCA